MDAVGGVRMSTDRDLAGRNFAFASTFKQAMAGARVHHRHRGRRVRRRGRRLLCRAGA
jgi:hypothetical protein